MPGGAGGGGARIFHRVGKRIESDSRMIARSQRHQRERELPCFTGVVLELAIEPVLAIGFIAIVFMAGSSSLEPIRSLFRRLPDQLEGHVSELRNVTDKVSKHLEVGLGVNGNKYPILHKPAPENFEI